MVFLLGLMIVGLAVLAGGQVWAFTGSTYGAWCAGALVLVLLSWLVRGLTNKTRRGPRMVGEVEEHIEEGDFTTLVPGQAGQQRERVQQRVMGQAEQAAYSIRSMLRDDASGKSGRS